MTNQARIDEEPTQQELDELKAIVPDIGELVNEFQRATLATNLNFILGNKSVREWLKRHREVGICNNHSLVDMVRAIRMDAVKAMVEQATQEAIKKQGWAIQGVFSNDPNDHSFAYSIGAKDILGVEVFIHACMDTKVLGYFVNEVLERLREGEDHAAIETSKGAKCTVGDGQQPSRLRVIKVPGEAALKANIFRLNPEVPEVVYQILLADANNALPGEGNYDTSMGVQFLTISGTDTPDNVTKH